MKFVARGGSIYAHLFENPRIGLARNLFWNINVELEPVEWHGKRWDCSFGCDWLVWPIRRLSELDGMSLGRVLQPDFVESTIYFVAEHHWVTVAELEIHHITGARYEFDAKGQADLEIDGLAVGGPFHYQCELGFDGVVVAPDNLTPSPASPTDVVDALAPYFELEGLQVPRRDGFRYVVPSAGGSYPSNPTNTAASSTDLRRDTTALAGKLSSG